MFTQIQLKQLETRGISLEQAISQLDIFKRGIKPVKLIRPAVLNDGIEAFDQHKFDYYLSLYEREKLRYSLIKFIPASGAASRMFKQLYDALNELITNPDDTTGILRKNTQLRDFFDDLRNYPFYNDLVKSCNSNGSDLDNLINSGRYAELLQLILSAGGLSYGELPKGLLKFHNYPDGARTAFEEHLVEAAFYLPDLSNKIKIHFTVSPEHLVLFEKLSAELIKKFSSSGDGCKFEVEFSLQQPSTDTLAADMENRPFTQENGKLLFRPGGHGALLYNMQDIKENIIFVGNIDNVAPDRIKKLRVMYKKLLAGILFERSQITHNFLKNIENGFSETLKNEILGFISKYVSVSISQTLGELDENQFVKYVFTLLDRPIRVCGMVKNIGEPGGGPFWVADKSENISKQIIESSQVNLNDPEQNDIFSKATHFNPVDLVCNISNYKGEHFKLEAFRDPDMSFIAIKSFGNSYLKALELPGLWNGSMAGWLTFFVEVPIETFSPVKTVFDLRRQEHIC